jgi:hypothetical protein
MAIHASFIQDLGVFIFNFSCCRNSNGSTSNHGIILSIFCIVAILVEMVCVVVAVKAQRTFDPVLKHFINIFKNLVLGVLYMLHILRAYSMENI